VPPNQDAFINNRTYEATTYGRDVIDWYNGSLVDHGARMLAIADQALATVMPSVPFGMKIPGVHWQMQNTPTPRIAEITAGLVQTTRDLRPVPQARKDAFGYEAIMNMIASTKKKMGRELVLHFTAVEMDNDPPSCPPPTNTSMAQTLSFWISDGATDHDITHKAENALACVDSHDGGCNGRSWQQIATVFDFAPYSGLTFLRLSRVPDERRCIPWNAEDRQDYASFIGAFKDARTVVVHLSEWEPCFAQTAGCSYSIFTWDNSKPRFAPFGLHYEGPQVENGRVCRQWWTGIVPNVRGGFAFTSNHTTNNDTTWERLSGEFDRIYDPGKHGNEIFVLGRNASVFTARPPCR
jgi:hypothetical protein